MRYSKVITLITTILLSVTIQAQKIIFTPQWTPQSQFAGFYVAQDMGFYKEAGVEVEFLHPSSSNSALNLLNSGKTNIISMQLLQAMKQIDQGADIINILQTSQHAGLIIVSRNESLRNIYDLKGKTVGKWKVGFSELAEIIDKEFDLNIKWVSFLQNINLYISGAIDASLAMSYNEYLQIKEAGYNYMPIIRFSEFDYDFPEDGVYVTKEFYENNKEYVDAFVNATKKGWEWTMKNQDKALEIVLKYMKEAKIPTNTIHQKWMLEEILRLQCDINTGKQSFELKQDKVERMSYMLQKHKFIKSPITVDILKGGRYEY